MREENYGRQQSLLLRNQGEGSPLDLVSTSAPPDPFFHALMLSKLSRSSDGHTQTTVDDGSQAPRNFLSTFIFLLPLQFQILPDITSSTTITAKHEHPPYTSNSSISSTNSLTTTGTSSSPISSTSPLSLHPRSSQECKSHVLSSTGARNCHASAPLSTTPASLKSSTKSHTSTVSSSSQETGGAQGRGGTKLGPGATKGAW